MKNLYQKLLVVSSIAMMQINYAQKSYLDTSFGVGGIAKTNTFNVTSMGLQADGKILVGGYKVNNSQPDYIICRFNSNGSIDESFGLGGIVEEALEGRQEITGVAQMPDGNILAAMYDLKKVTVFTNGSWYPGSVGPIAFMRYKSDGSKDQSFGTDGVKKFPFETVLYPNTGNSPNVMKILPDGRIAVGGDISSIGPASPIQGVFTIFTADVEKDITFHGNGSQALGISSCASLDALSDGSIVAVADIGTSTRMRKFTPEGNLDTAFGNAGNVLIQSVKPKNVQVLVNNKILLSGYRSSTKTAVLVLFNSDGSLDSSYGNSGILSFSGASTQQEYAIKSVELVNGKTISGLQRWNNSYDLGLTATDSNGNEDQTFGNQGQVITSLAGSQTLVSMIRQPDGKIILAGYDGNNVVLIRYDISEFLSTTSTTQRGIRLFPNPAKDFITLEGLTTNASYSIYNILGQKIDEGIFKNNNYRIDVKNYKEGVYVLSTLEGKYKFIKK